MVVVVDVVSSFVSHDSKTFRASIFIASNFTFLKSTLEFLLPEVFQLILSGIPSKRMLLETPTWKYFVVNVTLLLLLLVMITKSPAFAFYKHRSNLKTSL